MQWAGILVCLACAAGPNTLEAEYHIDFRREQFDIQRLRLIGTGGAKLLRPGPKGLWTGLPRGEALDVLGFAPKCVVHGDFEITVAYEILETSPPDSGYGVGPGIHLLTDTEAEIAATFSRLKRVEEGDVYVTHLAWYEESPGEDRKREHAVRLFKTNADRGALRLVRSGQTLRYLIADGEDPSFRQLHQLEFTDAPVELVRVGLHRNGAKTRAALVWKDFTLRADEITGFPRLSSGKGWLWVAVLLVAMALAGGGAWYWRRRKAA